MNNKKIKNYTNCESEKFYCEQMNVDNFDDAMQSVVQNAGVVKKQKRKKHSAKFSTKDIAVTAVLISLMLIFVFVPIKIGPLSLAVLPVMAVVIGCQAQNLKVGLVMGFAFGVASMCGSLLSGTSAIFLNPLISIFPRIMIPVTSYFTYTAIRKGMVLHAKKKKRVPNKKFCIVVASSVSGLVGAMTNTALVFAMMAVFAKVQNIEGLSALVAGAMALNVPIEWAVAFLVTPTITLTLRTMMKLEEPDEILQIKEENLNDDETVLSEDKNEKM